MRPAETLRLPTIRVPDVVKNARLMLASEMKRKYPSKAVAEDHRVCASVLTRQRCAMLCSLAWPLPLQAKGHLQRNAF